MGITQQNIDLIAKIIKNDRKYPNNEDLYEDFLNEACQRSAAIFDAVDNAATLEAYLKKVVTSSIIAVLKDSGRLRRTKTGYMSTTEAPLEPAVLEAVTVAPVTENIDYSSYKVSYGSVEIPKTPEENAIQREILDFVADTVSRIDHDEPEKSYMRLFVYRYDRGMTQAQIANDFGISQSEVCKRLYELIDKVKKILDEQ